GGQRRGRAVDVDRRDGRRHRPADPDGGGGRDGRIGGTVDGDGQDVAVAAVAVLVEPVVAHLPGGHDGAHAAEDAPRGAALRAELALADGAPARLPDARIVLIARLALAVGVAAVEVVPVAVVAALGGLGHEVPAQGGAEGGGRGRRGGRDRDRRAG